MRRVALAAVLLMAVPCAHAKTWHVDGDNASGIEDGTALHPYILISSAMSVAEYGDTVLVMPGEYSEWLSVWMYSPSGMNCASVVVPDGVVLTSSSGADSTTIHGVGTQAAVFFDACGPTTALNGFTIVCDGTGWGHRAAIIGYASQPGITGNTVTDGWSELYFRESSHAVISENVLDDVSFVSDSGGIVIDNEIAGTVGVDTNGNITVEGNVFLPSRGRWGYGLYIKPGSGVVEVVENNITGRNVGAYVCRGTFRGNRFTDNTTNLWLPNECSECEDVDAEMNWWGTVDETMISDLITDEDDDPSIPCSVDYTPWCLDADCTQSSTHSLTWGAVKARYRHPSNDARR